MRELADLDRSQRVATWIRELADLDRSQRVATWIRIEQHLRKYSFDQTEFLYSYSSVVTYIIPQTNLSGYGPVSVRSSALID
jgi:hypothetical protein